MGIDRTLETWKRTKEDGVLHSPTARPLIRIAKGYTLQEVNNSDDYVGGISTPLVSILRDNFRNRILRENVNTMEPIY